MVADNLFMCFPGQYYDSETNLHYNYFRTYDPSIGRYTQSDPIGLNGGFNTYSYVDSNPILSIDLYGLYKCKCTVSKAKPYPDSKRNSKGEWESNVDKQITGLVCWFNCECDCELTNPITKVNIKNVQGFNIFAFFGSGQCRGVRWDNKNQTGGFISGPFDVDTISDDPVADRLLINNIEKEMDEVCPGCTQKN